MNIDTESIYIIAGVTIIGLMFGILMEHSLESQTIQVNDCTQSNNASFIQGIQNQSWLQGALFCKGVELEIINNTNNVLQYYTNITTSQSQLITNLRNEQNLTDCNWKLTRNGSNYTDIYTDLKFGKVSINGCNITTDGITYQIVPI